MKPERSPASAALSRADRIDAILPQTQCRRCGFEGCRPYAEALAAGRSEINRCPPGGESGVARLAELLGRAVLPIDPECGDANAPRLLARIIEEQCIGCTMCIQACPVDAIIGAPKRMHTVIVADCTGCELCVAPCPVDCIVLEPVPTAGTWTLEQADQSRARHLARKERLARKEIERARDRIEHGVAKLADFDAGRERAASEFAPAPDPAEARKRAIIEAAIRRARERLGVDHSGRRHES
jgi:electron transport complex protein RnfB